MHLIIQHTDQQITHLSLGQIVAQVTRAVAVALDQGEWEAFAREYAGQSVAVSKVEQATAVTAERLLLLLADGQIVTCTPDTLVLDPTTLDPALLLDLVEQWRAGKYRVVAGAVAPNPAWQEPLIELPAAAETGKVAAPKEKGKPLKRKR